PWGLRALLGYDRQLCSEILGALAGEVIRSLKWRAKRALGLTSIKDAHTGTVTVVQRVDSSLRLNVHFHLLALDGVYVHQADGALVWHSLSTPTRAEVQDVAARTARCIQGILRAHGRSLDPALQTVDEPDRFAQDQPALAACYAAAAQGVSLAGDRAGQPSLRLMLSCDPPEQTPGDLPDEPVAEVGGVNLHAKVVIDGRDRERVERLVRYITRPALSEQRLQRLEDGRVQLTLKSPWRDGTRAFVFEPFDLIARLLAAVPLPRFHRLRHHGVLAPHSQLRSAVAPQPPEFEDPIKAPASGDQRELFEPAPDPNQAPPYRKPWAWLLRHVFLKDVSHCPRCGGPMRFR
ncbi:transposase, partial [Myxococcota bacterium]